jgi:drug/metabolite transporter (DMT)-like permease
MSRRAWIAFAAISLIWGVPYLFIRIAVRHGVPPFALAWGRITLGARFDHSEKPTKVRFIGLLIGFAGVIVLVGVDVAGGARALVGTGAVLVAALGYAIGPMLIKPRLENIDARTMMGASLAIAAVILTPAAIIDAPKRVPPAGAIASVAVLGVLCTAVAFVILAVLVREAGPGRALVSTYINPVIAVALGVALLNERPAAGAVAGLLLIWPAHTCRPAASVRQSCVCGVVSPSRRRLRGLDQHDRVEHEQHREHHGPAVQVALDERSAAERPSAGADAEGAREARVLTGVHQHETDQDDAEEHLEDVEDRRHASGMVAPTVGSESSSSRRISIASARSAPSTAS